MKIGWIHVLKKVYGETIYGNMAQSILSKHDDLEIINAGLDPFKKYLYPKVLTQLSRVTGEKEVWIRNFDAILTMPYDRTKGKNIVLIHHIDHSFQSPYLRPSFLILEKIFYHHLKKVDGIVTVSKYWQNHFLEKGYPKVHLIYNAFDIGQFQFEDEEIFEFKRKFQLEGKPIVYLGNCKQIKGVVEAYHHLRGLKVYLVTSGQQEVKIFAPNLNLSYREYLLLLKSSSVVITMSKFKEGWNRTAHEAMLCKTPVVGSGLGGMTELLEGGKQIICKDFRDLKDRTIYAIEHPELGVKGYEFAKQFTVERFNEAWLNLVKNISTQK